MVGPEQGVPVGRRGLGLGLGPGLRLSLRLRPGLAGCGAAGPQPWRAGQRRNPLDVVGRTVGKWQASGLAGAPQGWQWLRRKPDGLQTGCCLRMCVLQDASPDQ